MEDTEVKGKNKAIKKKKKQKPKDTKTNQPPRAPTKQKK